MSNRSVSTIQSQRTERLINREYKYIMTEPKNSDPKPSTSTTGKAQIFFNN